MLREVIAQGKDVAEAKENARIALGVSELEDVQFEVLHMGSRGIFGIIGVKPAKVRAYIDIPDRDDKRRSPERKQKRPEHTAAEVQNEAADENAEPKSDDRQASAEAKKPRKRKNNKKKSDRPAVAHTDDKPSVPKGRVIPEAELKMERREVGEGEDMSFDFIRTLILDIGINATAELYSCDDGTRRITINGEDASILIGHHGDTLDALQYLANLACARKNINGERDKSRVTIDIEGYRAKREETLRALARRMAAKALRNKRSVMLEPMSAYERRIIHSEIQGIEGVSTNSIGSDNNRKIVIYLTDKKPQGIFDDENEVKTEANDGIATLEETSEQSPISDVEPEVEVEVEVVTDETVSDDINEAVEAADDVEPEAEN